MLQTPHVMEFRVGLRSHSHFFIPSFIHCSLFLIGRYMSQIKRVEEYAKKLRLYLEDPVDGEELLQVVKDIGNELMSNISEDNVGEFS